ncbi:hypothetical protein TNCT_11891 [Trichonephila clavata]|uniref:Uncharacterized protein n=1 Tax=Trichonephila clavata TaxID=2740835 RepID=A0A8X6F5T1_TRICU|nr:hypothetical protein TNCT_11891 [Trichonephila clavata]
MEHIFPVFVIIFVVFLFYVVNLHGTTSRLERGNKGNQRMSSSSVVVLGGSSSELILGRVLEIVAHASAVEQRPGVFGGRPPVRGGDHLSFSLEDVCRGILVRFAARHSDGRGCAARIHGDGHIVAGHLVSRGGRGHALRTTRGTLAELGRRAATDPGGVVRTATQDLRLNMLTDALKSADGP